MFITCGNHPGRFQNWGGAFILIKPDVVQLMSPQIWSQPPPPPLIKKSELSSCLSCWRDVNQFRVQERLMWVSDLTSSATRLSCFPQRRLSTLQEHCSVRIDVYISTAPKKSSPRLDKSCKKTGFGLRLSKGISHS